MNISELQDELQSQLKKRRREFVLRSKHDLPMAYIENRFHNEQYRNAFEVQRLWNRLTKELVGRIHNASQDRPALLAYSPRIIRRDARFLSQLASSADWEDTAEEAEHLTRELVDYIDEVLETQLEASEEAAKRRRERDVEYMKLMIEMMDRAEQQSEDQEEP